MAAAVPIADVALPLNRIIETIAGIEYVAEAPVGYADSDAVWRVFRIRTVGDQEIVEYAGSGGFEHAATTVETLTYRSVI